MLYKSIAKFQAKPWGDNETQSQ